MSEERRKHQQERNPEPSSPRKYLTWVVILVLLAAAYYAGLHVNFDSLKDRLGEIFIPGWHAKHHKYDAFAKCLATKNAKMYGLYWCSHCAEQKAMFDESFRYVPYVECAIKGSHDEAPACVTAGVKLFPNWQFGADPPKEGILSLDALSAKTGCSLP